MPGIDQTLDSKALTKMPSIGQRGKDGVERNSQNKEEPEQQVMEDSIWAPRMEKTKEKEENGAVAVWDGFPTQLGGQMTISGIFWHRCSTFQAKTDTALPALIVGSAPRATSSSGASS